MEKNASRPLPVAKRSLGQNFLRDANICRKIVRALNIGSEDRVLEIGPGPGALTDIIHAEQPAFFVALEKDSALAMDRMHYVPDPAAKRFFVVNADALHTPWEAFTEPWKIIGNLPYNVASPLMWDIFSRASGLVQAVFMVQKEVGQRLVAKPSTSAYGALSVWVQSFVTPKMEFIVPPHVFYPKPKIDSAVLSFLPLPASGRQFDPAALSQLLKISFQMRRKQLGSIFRSHGISMQPFELAGINPERRPESLLPEDFHCLAASMKKVIRD